MPGFTYYLPGIAIRDLLDGNPMGGTLKSEVLASFGLAHLDDVKIAGTDAVVSEVRSHGPDAGAGVVLYVRPQAEKMNQHIDETWSLKYNADKQVWSAAIHGRYWIGYDREHVPTPEDLRRAVMIDGYWVPDADKHTWQIPTARTPDNKYGRLPVSLTFDAAGDVVSKLQPKFDYLWKIGCELFDRTQSETEVDDAELLDWSIQAIGCNYRFGRSEQRVLFDAGRSMCDQAFFVNVVGALLDFKIAKDVVEEKKTEASSDQPPASLNTPHGTEDSDQSTDQALPN